VTKYKEHDLVVIWADIVKWSYNDATKQIEQAKKVAQIANTIRTSVMKNCRISESWMAWTGDGFAIGFSGMVSDVMKEAAEAFEKHNVKSDFKIRLAASFGLSSGYENPLTRKNEMCGYVIIETRRIIEAIHGSKFYVGKSLAKNLIGQNNDLWRSRLVELQPIKDKHGNEYDVYEYVPGYLSKNFASSKDIKKVDSSVMKIAEALNCYKEHLRMPSISNTILHWIDSACTGLSSDAVSITPTWDFTKINETGIPNEIGDIDSYLRDNVKNLMESDPTIKNMDERQNRPKVWIKRMEPPLTDRPFLKLELGGLDYKNNRAIETLYTTSMNWNGKQTTLKQLYEDNILDISEYLPNMVVAHIIMKTTDDYLVLTQRSSTNDYAKKKFSPSCEEQWNPKFERLPHGTVTRCLEEEFNLDSAHGVNVQAGHISLIAVGREWNQYWNTALFFTVDLPCSHKDVINCWKSLPKDKYENKSVGLINVGVPKNRSILLKQIKHNECRPDEFKNSRWIGGKASSNEFHPTTGLPRLIFGLCHWFGINTILKESTHPKTDHLVNF
jgi:hypothetical protein